MADNFSGVTGIAAAIAAVAVGKMLAGKSPWIRWPATLLAAGVVGGVLGYAQQFAANYRQRYDPVASAHYVQTEMERLSPDLVSIAEQADPQAWQAFITRAGQKIAATGGNPSPAEMQQIGAELRVMLKGLWPAVAMADTQTLVALNRQEVAIDQILQREDVKMCATRGNALWNLNDLPPEGLKAVQDFMALISFAYRQGKGRPVELISDDQAAEMLRNALALTPTPISDSDFKYIYSGDTTDPDRMCRLKLQFNTNISLLPGNEPLLRWLYDHSFQ